MNRLDDCHPTSQWVFERMVVLLKKSTPEGYLQQTIEELSKQFKTSKGTICFALKDLHDKGVMRKSSAGYWYSPGIVGAWIEECIQMSRRRNGHALSGLSAKV